MDNMDVLEPLADSTPEGDSKQPTDDVSQRIIWIDLEMSGLDHKKERIIEIAVSVTDCNLTKMAKGPNHIIHQSEELMNAMDPWCIDHHGKSGLTAAVLASKITESDAEQSVLDFVRKYTPEGECALGGNSIYMDKMFLLKYMPDLCQHTHYRLIDVSTIKELVKRWMPDVVKNAPKKADKHRASDDICDSIRELKYYKSAAFIPH